MDMARWVHPVHEVGDSASAAARFTGSRLFAACSQGCAFGSTLGFTLMPAPRAEVMNFSEMLLELMGH